MNTELLLTHFGRISDAPDAIPRLRRFILDLAVRGKLVEQDPNDESASQLLKRIQEEKTRLVNEGKIHREKPPTPASPDDLAFALRPNWVAARISQILVELQTGPFGSSLHQSDYQRGGVPVINPASIKNERLVPVESMAVGRATLERLASFKLRAGDIVMARRGEMGRCAVVNEKENGWLCGTGSLILRLPQCVFARFFVILIGSPFVREYLGGSAVGATMQNLNQSILLNLVVGIPPLPEQHRIVAKVDELMAICDRLEAAEAEQESRRNTLTVASHHHLSNGSDDGASRKHALFFLGHLPCLTARPVHIQQLRQTILNLAVRGQLSAQDPHDEPASELLREIQADKHRDLKPNTRMTDEALRAILPNEIPYQLPSGWEWVRLGLLGDTNIGLTYSPQDVSDHGIPVLRSNNIRDGKLVLSDVVRVDTDVKPSALVNEGDLLICARNGSRTLVGKAAIITELHETTGFGAFMAIFRSRLNRYIYLFICSPLFRLMIDEVNTNTINQLTQANLRSTLAPIPPLAEQHRIVAKVDELMALCDRLEAQLATAQEETSRLLESVLHHALNVEDAPPVEAHSVAQ